MGMTGVLEGSLIAGCYSAGGVVYASGNGDYAEWLELENEEEEILKTDIVGVKGGKISTKSQNGIDRPEFVSLVIPPTTIIRTIRNIIVKSHLETILLESILRKDN